LQTLIATILFCLPLFTFPNDSWGRQERLYNDTYKDTVDVYLAVGISIIFNSQWKHQTDQKILETIEYPPEPMKDFLSEFPLSLDRELPFLGARFGFIFPNFNRRLALEWEYNYMKMAFAPNRRVTTQNPNILFSRNDKFALNFLFVNLVFRYPEGVWHPYFGAGIGSCRMQKKAGKGFYNAPPSDLNPDGAEITDFNFPKESYVSHPYQIFAGVDYDITPEWGIGIRCKVIDTRFDFSVLESADLNLQGLFIEIKRTW